MNTFLKQRIISYTFCFILLIINTFSLKSQNLILPIKQNGLWGAVDTSGRMIIAPKYDFISTDQTLHYAEITKNQFIGLVDNSGNELVSPTFGSVLFFPHFALFKKVNAGDRKKYYYNYKTFDSYNLKKLIRMDSSLEENKLFVYNFTTKKINPLYVDKIQISKQIGKNNFYTYKIDSKVGLLNQYAEYVSDSLYDEIKFDVPRKNVMQFVKRYRMGLADENGVEFIPPMYSHIDTLDIPEYYRVRTNNWQTHIINNKNQSILPNDVSNFSYVKNRGFFASKGVSWGFWDLKGKNIIPAIYDEIDTMGNYFRIKYNKKHGVIDAASKMVVASMFDQIEYLHQRDLFKVYSVLYVKDRYITFCGVLNKFGEVLLNTSYLNSKILIDYELNTIKGYNDSGMMVVNFRDNGKLIERILFKNYTKPKLYVKRVNFWKLDKDEKKYGFYAANGAEIFAPVYDSYKPYFLNDSALVKTCISKSERSVYGVVNQVTGKEILPCKFIYISESDVKQYDVIRSVSETCTFRLLSSKGEPIGKTFSYIGDFVNDQALVALDGESSFTKGDAITTKTPKWVKLPSRYQQLRNEYNYIQGWADFIDAELIKPVEPVFNVTSTGGYWGVINTRGEFVVPCNYRYISDYFDGKYIVRKGEKWGSIDNTGKTLIDFKYELLQHFYREPQHDSLKATGLYCATKNKKCGVINTNDSLIIKFLYDEVKYLANSDGLFFGVRDYSKWGLINSQGDTIIPIMYDAINYLSATDHNHFKVSYNDVRYGFITDSLKIVTDAVYANASGFKNGYAAVKQEDKWTFIDRSGKRITQNAFENVKLFSENLAAVEIDGLWGFTDNNGIQVINPMYNEVGDFAEGKAWVKTITEGAKPGKKYQKITYTYINQENKTLITGKFKNVSNFKNGYAVVKLKRKYAIIDSTGKIVFKAKCSNIIPYNQYGLAYVYFKKGNITIIDKIGKQNAATKDLKIRDIGDFCEGYATIQTNKGFGYIDSTGSIVMEPVLSGAFDFHEGLARIKDGRKFGFINKKFKQYTTKYTACDDYRGGISIVEEANNVYAIDLKGKKLDSLPFLVRPCDYNEGIAITKGINGYFFVKQDGTRLNDSYYSQAFPFVNNFAFVQDKSTRKWGIINRNGAFFLKCVITSLEPASQGIRRYGMIRISGIYDSFGKVVAPVTYLAVEPISPTIFQLQNLIGLEYFKSNGSWIWRNH